MEKRFLVRFSRWYFFHSMSGGRPVGCEIPVLAEDFSYPAAYEIAKRLQALGYEDSIVVATTGLPTVDSDFDPLSPATLEEIEAAWTDTKGAGENWNG